MSIRATSAGLGTSGVDEAVEDAAASDTALDGKGVARGDDDGVAADAAVAESGFELLDCESVAAPSLLSGGDYILGLPHGKRCAYAPAYCRGDNDYGNYNQNPEVVFLQTQNGSRLECRPVRLVVVCICLLFWRRHWRWKLFSGMAMIVVICNRRGLLVCNLRSVCHQINLNRVVRGAC